MATELTVSSGSFYKRKLTITITLKNQNALFSNGSNTLTISGLRAICEVKNAGGMLAPQLNLDVYGMLEADMNALTTLYIDNVQPGQSTGNIPVVFNEILVQAGSANFTVFSGEITQAWGVYQNAPDVYLHIEGITAYAAKNTYIEPTSLTELASIADIVAGLAKQMNYEFINNGVNDVGKPYLYGSAVDQVRYLANAYNFTPIFENNTLTIVPKRTAKQVEAALVNAGTGLIGWPTFDKLGIQFKSLFNPKIQFMGTVVMETSNIRANGTWLITKLTWHLESEKPNGAWFQSVECAWRLNS